MELELYMIKDEMNGYTTPIPFNNENIAKRYFKDQMLTNVTMINSPEDFSLWKAGTFNTEKGTIKQTNEDLKLLERGSTYANKN